MKLIKANIPVIEAEFAKLVAKGKTDKTFFDPELRGFGLRLRASGRQSWICHFERNGKQEKLTIGNAKVLTADEARHKAREILRDADLGRSPRAKRAEEKAKQRITFSYVAERYLQAKQQELRPNSLRGATYYLQTIWKPLAGMAAHEISRRDIAILLNEIAAKNGRTAAARARSNLSAMFKWAMGEVMVEANPVVGTNNPTKNVARERVLKDAELRRYGSAAVTIPLAVSSNC